jgi:hypothetical protein
MTSTAYVLVHDIAASWEGYRAIEERLQRPPAGLLLHVAGATDEGFRIVEVWQTQADFRRFESELREGLRGVDPIAPASWAVRDLRARHVVVGDAWCEPNQSSLEEIR